MAIGRVFWGKISDLIDRPRALNFGGCFALFPALTADSFGTKNLGIDYGWVFTAFGAAGIIGPIVGGVLFDVTGQGALAFVFAGTLCFLAAGISVAIWGLARGSRP